MLWRPCKTARYLSNMKEKFYDKSTIHLPRHSSFTIMQSFAKWGNTGQNVAESLGPYSVFGVCRVWGGGCQPVPMAGAERRRTE